MLRKITKIGNNSVNRTVIAHLSNCFHIDISLCISLKHLDHRASNRSTNELAFKVVLTLSCWNISFVQIEIDYENLLIIKFATL